MSEVLELWPFTGSHAYGITQEYRPLEAQLQATLNVVPAYTWYALPSGALTFVSERTADYLGLLKDHPLRFGIDTGAAWDSHIPLLHPDDHDETRRIWSTCLRTGCAGEVSFRVQDAEGGYRWFLSRAEPLRTNDGTLLYWIGLNLDIDDEKRAEDALRKSEKELRGVIDTIPPTVWSAQRDGLFGTTQEITERTRAEQALHQSEFYLAEGQRLAHMGSWAWRVPERDAVHLSDEWYRIYGFDPGLGMPPWQERLQRVHPEDRNKWRETIEKAIREKSHYEVEFRILLPEGTLKWVHTVGHPVVTATGELVQFVGSSMDVTVRKRAEEKLKEQETELRQMLDLAPQLVAVFGPRRERLYANRVLLDYIGITLDEWRQRSDNNEFIHQDDRERVRADSEHAFSSGSAYELEFRVHKSDGRYRWFLTRFSPVHDGNGRIIRWYVASTDIDDRKRAEERLQEENAALREEIDQASMFEEIVGTSSALRRVLSGISKVAPSHSTVLITGETGTGKELIARAIHRRSGRGSRAFVSVNCAAIPRDLVASELFGHEKGAFTGATQRRLGRFELADGGTIFLDEVGELLPDTQVALLRVLQEREFERVGGTQPIHVDVRIIAATNRNLDDAVANGTFRPDLFYRLNVVPIEMPSLRERKEDVLMLVEYFVQRYATKAGKRIRSIDNKSLDLLQSYDWPGNIRELQNVIERSVILSSGEILSVDEFWLSKKTAVLVSRVERQPTVKFEAEPRSEREIIEAALASSRGRVAGPSGAAAKLRIPPSTLDHRIKALRINKSRFKFL
jgi:formate hydrogenlyase transcriptional activator